MIYKHRPLNGDYNRDPGSEARKRRGFMYHGSTLIGSQSDEEFAVFRVGSQNCNTASWHQGPFLPANHFGGADTQPTRKTGFAQVHS